MFDSTLRSFRLTVFQSGFDLKRNTKLNSEFPLKMKFFVVLCLIIAVTRIRAEYKDASATGLRYNDLPLSIRELCENREEIDFCADVVKVDGATGDTNFVMKIIEYALGMEPLSCDKPTFISPLNK